MKTGNFSKQLKIKAMKNNIKIIRTMSLCGMLMALLLSWNSIYCQNVALHFDGGNDFITLNPIGNLSGKNFTVDMWFKVGTEIECSPEPYEFRRLFSLEACNGQYASRFDVGECGGILRVMFGYSVPSTNPIHFPTWYYSYLEIEPDKPILVGEWHHIAVVRVIDNLEDNLKVYLDCSVDLAGDQGNNFFHAHANTPTPTIFRVGKQSTDYYSFMPIYYIEGLDWNGTIDEVRLWNIARSELEIQQVNCKPCPLNPMDFPDQLIVNWTFDDWDIDLDPLTNYDNRDKKVVFNYIYLSSGWMPPQYNFGKLSRCDETYPSGHPVGFALQGTGSNFVTSDAPLLPSYLNHKILLKDATMSAGINKICSGDPVHFSIVDVNGDEPASWNVKRTIKWYYSDKGPNPTDWKEFAIDPNHPAFNGFAFYSGADHEAVSLGVNHDCKTKSDVNRYFQARIIVGEEPDECVYIVNHDLFGGLIPLKICCLVENLSLTISPGMPPDLLCENDLVNFTVTVNTGLPAPDPTNSVNISWAVKINSTTTHLTGPDYTDQETIGYPYLGFMQVPAGTICFSATVSNCGCSINDPNSETITKCITIDERPVCGKIIGLANLKPTNDPNFYRICPGDDAAIAIDDNSPFSKCRPQWQYRFPSVGTWENLGFTNTSQNTNVLPHLKPEGSPYLWPAGDTCIEYQIECLPLNHPNSGCPSCFSNVIKVCLVQPPEKPIIKALKNPICDGESTTLQIVGPPPHPNLTKFSYQWYLDGEAIPDGTDLTYTASQPGLYFLTATEPVCGLTASSDPIFLQVCIVVAKICCPIPDCPCPGDTIKVPGSCSFSTCGEPLTYEWWRDGVLLPDNTESILDVPDEGGTTYTLKVTDPYDCTDEASRTIFPCHERPFVCGEPIVDKRDGRKYQTVEIGTQCWMKENLDVGTMINGSESMTDNNIIEKYCHNNNPANCDTYGGLYQWDEVMQYSTTGVQGICPDGWHLPSYWEWETLLNFLEDNSQYHCEGNSENIAKSLASADFWNTSSVICAVGNTPNNNNATDFTGLPGGYRYSNGSFYSLYEISPWWSSNLPAPGSDIYYVSLSFHKPDVNFWYFNKNYGFGLRCIR